MEKTRPKTEYDIQAHNFLLDTGTTFEVRFLGNMFYFEDDKETRDVYEITFVRDAVTWTFKFGQSLANSGEYYKRNPQGKTIWDHELIRRKRIEPTAYDVLACITKYDPGTFEDFCADCGYDVDSRKAERQYFAVQKEWQECEKLFGDVMETLREIQ